MKRISALLILALLGPLTVTGGGCLSRGASTTPHQRHKVNAERALIIIATVVEEAHKTLWSNPLRAKVEECGLLPQESIPACMGVFTPEANRKIGDALEAYAAAARVAGQGVLLSDGDTDVSSLIEELLTAASEIFDLIPKADAYRAKMNLLTQGLVR